MIGRVFYGIGRFEKAGRFGSRGCGGKERDGHGRIDHESLGVSLNQEGDCLFSAGEREEDGPWSEREVTGTEKGDVHGRIDHESLSLSLHLVGDCLSSAGQYAEAQPWFERAVVEAEK